MWEIVLCRRRRHNRLIFFHHNPTLLRIVVVVVRRGCCCSYNMPIHCFVCPLSLWRRFVYHRDCCCRRRRHSLSIIENSCRQQQRCGLCCCCCCNNHSFSGAKKRQQLPRHSPLATLCPAAPLNRSGCRHHPWRQLVWTKISTVSNIYYRIQKLVLTRSTV